MRAITFAAVAAAACVSLTACSSAQAPSSDGAAPAPAASVHPSGAASPGLALTGGGASAGPALALGATAKTVGVSTPTASDAVAGAEADLTPTTVDYVQNTPSASATNGQFVIVTVHISAPGQGAQENDLGAGGWTWVSPNGTRTASGLGTAPLVKLRSYHTTDAPAGEGSWFAPVFDVQPGAEGGTLEYVDGKGQVFRWQMPAMSSGPQQDQLARELAGA